MSDAKFVPFGSFIDAGFWSVLNKKKLEEWKLDDSPKTIKATFSLCDSVGTECRQTLSHESFDSSDGDAYGKLVVFNTLEDFKKLDKKQFINQVGAEIWNSLSNGKVFERPSILYDFAFIVFADLKKFHYYYWSCSPAVLEFPKNVKQSVEASSADSKQLLDYYAKNKKPIFVYKNGECLPFETIRDCEKSEEIEIVFADPSPVKSVPGWPARNILASIAYLKPTWTNVHLISLRDNGEEEKLELLTYSWQASETPSEPPSFTGWEYNEGQLKPRFVNMKNQFDPKKLMEQSVGLNLSLIKWRLVPEIQLDRFENLKVLIFGAGTLGCNLARNLLAYNVKTISFIDNSTVNYSNPVRQSLSTFEDAKQARGKAEVAADALRQIYPSVNSQAYQLTVPMPGHSVSSSEESSLEATVQKLEELVSAHDVLFLALDSREARWFPTVLANKFGKMSEKGEEIR